jgi:hypothetical protein
MGSVMRPFACGLSVAALLAIAACSGSPMNMSSSPGPNPTPSVANEWEWVSGSDTVNPVGMPGSASYGILGVASPTNMPGQRMNAMSWTDKSGNLWLFGGFGTDTVSGSTSLNDLWEFSGGEWTWMAGSDKPYAQGVYGTRGVPSAGNTPGARHGGATWTDGDGNLWLFGGEELSMDPFNNVIGIADYNDLWKFADGKWTWVAGPKAAFSPAVYGKMREPSPENLPGARYGAGSWIDAKGDLWIFGGWGRDSVASNGPLNDLWKYEDGEWSWMGGSKFAGQPGSYGTRGKASSENLPGARASFATWTDASGNFWLFGGSSIGGELNDLWKYADGEWTWVGGSNQFNQPGVYGAKGTAGEGNIPGGRDGAVAWTDSSGDFWLFGGFAGGAGNLNDLWKFSNGEWTWVAGSDKAQQAGVYGTKGTPAAGNTPGARYGAVGWTDKDGNLWLFGGEQKAFTWFYDLWELKP